MIATLEKHQIAILIIFIPLVFKMAMLPGMLYQTVGADMWISILLLLCFEVLQIIFILWIQKLGGIERFKKVIGEKRARLILLPLVVVLIGKGVVFFNETANYVSSYLFYNVADWSIRLGLLIAIVYLALKGVKAMGRIAELSLIFLPFIVIIGMGFGKVDLHFNYILPVLGNGFAPVLDGVWKYLFYAFDFSPLLFIGIAEKKRSPLPKERGLNLNINHRKKTIPWYLIGITISVLSVVGTYLLFIASYGEAGYLVDNAFARLASFNVVTTEIGSIDWPAVILWLTMAVICISLRIWATGAIGDSFGLKREVSIVVAAIILWVIATFVLKNVTIGVEFAESGWRFVVVGIETIVTLAVFGILGIAHIKQKRKQKREATYAA